MAPLPSRAALALAVACVAVVAISGCVGEPPSPCARVIRTFTFVVDFYNGSFHSQAASAFTQRLSSAVDARVVGPTSPEADSNRTDANYQFVFDPAWDHYGWHSAGGLQLIWKASQPQETSRLWVEANARVASPEDVDGHVPDVDRYVSSQASSIVGQVEQAVGAIQGLTPSGEVRGDCPCPFC